MGVVQLASGGQVCRHNFAPDILKQVRDIRGLDNYHGPLALLSDYTVISLAIAACVWFGWIAYPFALVIIGSRQRALATLTHEASHRVLAQNRILNDLLGTFCSGYLIGVLFHAYHTSHVKNHHGRFGDREIDNDYRYMLDMGVYVRSPQSRYTWNILVRPLLLLRVHDYLAYTLRDRLLILQSAAGRSELVRFCIFWALLVSGIIYAGFGWEFLIYWVVPFLTTFQIIGWYIELAEHAPLMNAGLDIHMSRNRNSHWIERMLTGNHCEFYHLAHHIQPKVPFWNLRKLNEILRQDPVYRAHNDACGGIFLSNNNAPSVASVLSKVQECGSGAPGSRPWIA